MGGVDGLMEVLVVDVPVEDMQVEDFVDVVLVVPVEALTFKSYMQYSLLPINVVATTK